MLIAFNLRTAITSLGPVLLDAIADLHLTGAEASLLTTIPSKMSTFLAFVPTITVPAGFTSDVCQPESRSRDGHTATAH